MIRRWRLWGVILLLAVAAGGAAVAWDAHLRARIYEEYGPTPGLFVSWLRAGDSTCQQVDDVGPTAHYNWLGRIWQEDHLLWEDVQVQHPPPTEFPHGKAGPVRVGDVICGFGEVSDIRYVHRPTGAVLTETCESYRCPYE